MSLGIMEMNEDFKKFIIWIVGGLLCTALTHLEFEGISNDKIPVTTIEVVGGVILAPVMGICVFFFGGIWLLKTAGEHNKCLFQCSEGK
jgi:hypothetical protein